jgi:hypothetical protein
MTHVQTHATLPTVHYTALAMESLHYRHQWISHCLHLHLQPLTKDAFDKAGSSSQCAANLLWSVIYLRLALNFRRAMVLPPCLCSPTPSVIEPALLPARPPPGAGNPASATQHISTLTVHLPQKQIDAPEESMGNIRASEPRVFPTSQAKRHSMDDCCTGALRCWDPEQTDPDMKSIHGLLLALKQEGVPPLPAPDCACSG